jgi:hypothetical protein
MADILLGEWTSSLCPDSGVLPDGTKPCIADGTLDFTEGSPGKLSVTHSLHGGPGDVTIKKSGGKKVISFTINLKTGGTRVHTGTIVTKKKIVEGRFRTASSGDGDWVPNPP